MSKLLAHAAIVLLRALSVLPLAGLAALGTGLGVLLFHLARSRRHIALRNLALCLPALPEAERVALARQHFGWLGRSLIERGLLWYAKPARLRQLITVHGDVSLAERSEKPVMWLVPHFVGLDVAGAATQLFQTRVVASIYQTQTNPVFDAALRAGRLRHGRAEIFSRAQSAKPLMRAVKQGHAFFNLPDMDFGGRDAAFIPFFGVPASTLLAPSRMARALDMVVQPITVELLPGAQGYRVEFLPAWDNFPSADPEADALRFNQWLEQQILKNPAQYLWTHRRFKTRPPGEASLY